MTTNPFSERPPTSSEHPPPKGQPTAEETYKIITDTVTGANVRVWDNALQAVVAGFCLLLGVLIGWLYFRLSGGDQLMGVLAGAFVGLLVGLFGSGIFLMIYRALRHIRG